MNGKAPLPFHPSGAVGQGCAGKMCGRDARVPGGPSSTQQTGNMIYVTPRIGAKRRLQGPKRPTAPLPFHPGGAVGQRCAGKMVRAGRPRSRVGIFHTTNREHDLRHAQDWGKAPFASLTYHPRERGRLARNLIPGWRRWSVSATLRPGSHPARVYGMGQSE